ncbi:MAG: hypothetical protein NVV59_16425 [Chitinophagaceae bacterium]|nr:hypothetical protein [Chitinophagaceae bacterium]
MRFTLILIASAFFLSAKCQSFQLNFDFSNAAQTLRWVTSPDADEIELKKLLELPSTKALQKKLRTDSVTMRQALLSVHDSSLYKPEYARFGYRLVAARANDLGRFLTEIKEREDSLRFEVEKALAHFVPKGTSLPVTVTLLLGGNSSGFTLGGDNIFYVGLQQYKNDFIGIRETCKHELFHNIQRLYRDHFSYSDQLDQHDKTGYAYLHFMLVHLFQEGSAEYVADLRKVTDPNALYVREARNQAAVNDYRSEEVFYLISKMLYEATKFPDQTKQGPLYSILFDWNWNNPGYYAGYVMVKALCAEYGDNRLMEYLQKDPSEFVYDYIQLTKKHPEKYPFAFTEEFETIVNELREELKKLPAQK